METIPTFKFTKKQIRDYEKNLKLLSKRDNDPFKFEFDRIKSKETFVILNRIGQDIMSIVQIHLEKDIKFCCGGNHAL